VHDSDTDGKKKCSKICMEKNMSNTSYCIISVVWWITFFYNVRWKFCSKILNVSATHVVHIYHKFD
jgi:hypothetical protein